MRKNLKENIDILFNTSYNKNYTTIFYFGLIGIVGGMYILSIYIRPTVFNTTVSGLISILMILIAIFYREKIINLIDKIYQKIDKFLSKTSRNKTKKSVLNDLNEKFCKNEKNKERYKDLIKKKYFETVKKIKNFFTKENKNERKGYIYIKE